MNEAGRGERRRQRGGRRQRAVRGSVRSSTTCRPLRSDTWTSSVSARVSAAPTVSAPAEPPGPATLPNAGPAGPSFPAADDDERVEPERSVDGAGCRIVCKGRVRRCHSDERDARGVVGVAVRVRVDRALEPGDQLVGAGIEGKAAAPVRLPACDANRQDRRAARDAVRGRWAAVADEDASHLRPVSLDFERTTGR